MSEPRSFDPRIVPPKVVALARSSQARAPSVLGGGAALAGVYLRHRHSHDLDLFFRDRDEQRIAVRTLGEAARDVGLQARIVRDAGTFVRAVIEGAASPLEIDLVFEPTAPVEPPAPVEGVQVSALADLRASKLTCILSRSEPRDLVDLLFLERAGFPPEGDLGAALTKDAGIDPATLAWLLRQFPISPLPALIAELGAGELEAYREALAERFARLAVP